MGHPVHPWLSYCSTTGPRSMLSSGESSCANQCLGNMLALQGLSGSGQLPSVNVQHIAGGPCPGHGCDAAPSNGQLLPPYLRHMLPCFQDDSGATQPHAQHANVEAPAETADSASIAQESQAQLASLPGGPQGWLPLQVQLGMPLFPDTLCAAVCRCCCLWYRSYSC